jgi:hypothetical protein
MARCALHAHIAQAYCPSHGGTTRPWQMAALNGRRLATGSHARARGCVNRAGQWGRLWERRGPPHRMSQTDAPDSSCTASSRCRSCGVCPSRCRARLFRAPAACIRAAGTAHGEHANRRSKTTVKVPVCRQQPWREHAAAGTRMNASSRPKPPERCLTRASAGACQEQRECSPG